MRIELPWPPKELNPNSRLHWAKVASAKKAYRSACGWEAKAQGVKPVSWPFASVLMTFHPPHLRGDDDNAIAAFKSGRDGVADALGLDDRKWRPSYRMGEVVKGGLVVLEFSEHDGSRVPYSPLTKSKS